MYVEPVSRLKFERSTSTDNEMKLALAALLERAATNLRRCGPLHYTADGFITGPARDAGQQVETIRCLLQHGADISLQDRNGATPLHRAVRTRCAAAVRFLLVFTCTAVTAQSCAVFKSIDRGQSWVRADTGMLDPSRINGFGSLDDTLFAGTDSGVFLSQNEAGSWKPSTGLAKSSGRIICFATLERRVFAGTDGTGILESSDKGASWVVNAAFPFKNVRCLLADQERLYAGTDACGVLVSSDLGRTWTALPQGFPDHAQVFALSMVHDRLFAGLYSKGLYAWKEPDHRWTKAGDVSPLVLASIAGTLVAGHNPGGIHWSADLGASWSQGTAKPVELFTGELPDPARELSSEAPVWELAADEELVIAGASAGIYYSEDQGRTWTRAWTGLPPDSPGVAFLLNRSFILAGIPIKN